VYVFPPSPLYDANFTDNQAPQPGFQQYYPLAGRNLYGQPTPPTQPAPIPQAKPAQTQSPYGGQHTQPYPSAGYDDQSSFNSAGGGRFGESKAPSVQPAYANQGLQGFLGVGAQQANASRQQGPTSDDGFKSSTPQSSVSAAPAQGQQAQQGQAQGAGAGVGGQGLRGPQGFGAGYPGYNNGGYQAQAQAQDWSQYGQYSGGGRASGNGYASWQQ
jgi:hypothetical protein